MQKIDEVEHAKALLNANKIDSDGGTCLIDAFNNLGDDAFKRLKREGVVRTLEDVEKRFMDEVVMGGGLRPRVSEDAMNEELNAWVDKEYQEVGKTEYVHVYDIYALQDVIFDMSHNWYAAHKCEGNLVDELAAFITNQVLTDSLRSLKKEEISKKTLM